MEAEKTAGGNQSIFYLDVDDITPDPNQPRKHFNQKELESLAHTMETQDIINPIEVDDDNVLVTGERRWRAAKIAGKKKVPCIRWAGTLEERFERQVVENLHHDKLTEQDRDAALVKLWGGGAHTTQASLAKAVGMSRESVRDVLVANTFREQTSESLAGTAISNTAILETSGLEEGTRVKILKAVDGEVVNSRDIRDLKKIAQSSEALLDKTLEGTVSVERALEASETIQKIEQGGVVLKPEEKQRLADNIEKDQDLIKKYSEDVLDRVYSTMTTPKANQENQSTPIGRTNPVTYIVAVKDEILANFRRHIGNCDTGERRWALKVLKEIRDEVEILIEVVSK